MSDEFLTNKGGIGMSNKSAEASQVTTTSNIEDRELFQKGEGTAESPFEIHNEKEFRSIGHRPNACFILSESITLQSPTVTIPEFTGVIYGNGNQIDGLVAEGSWIRMNRGKVEGITFNGLRISNSPLFPLCGLFEVNTGGIRDLHVRDGKVESCDPWEKSIASGLVGYNHGMLERASYQGAVSSQKGRVARGVTLNIGNERYAVVGGIAGIVDINGTVSRCTSEVWIEYLHPDKAMGSIVGINQGAIISVEVRRLIRIHEDYPIGFVVGIQSETGTLSDEGLYGIEFADSHLTPEERELLVEKIVATNYGDKRGE